MHKIIPFINKADLSDLDTLELIELEIRDLMGSFKFPDAETCPVVFGSAKLALEGDTGTYGKQTMPATFLSYPQPDRVANV